MGAAEDELRAIAATPLDWDIPALEALQASAIALADTSTRMMPDGWTGKAADAASEAFINMRGNFVKVEEAAANLLAILGRANDSRSRAIQALKTAQLMNDSVITAAPTPPSSIAKPASLPGLLGSVPTSMPVLVETNPREEYARAALTRLENELVVHQNDVKAEAETMRDFKPAAISGDPTGGPGVAPSAPYSPAPRAPYVPVAPANPTLVAVPDPTIGTALPPVYNPPVEIGPGPIFIEDPRGPSIDDNGPGHAPTLPTPGGSHIPGGTADFPNGGSGGNGGGGGGGLIGGHTPGGAGAGLLGGGAAAAAAAAAKARLAAGSGGAGGLGGSGARIGAGGLGGANGVGAGGSAGGAGGIGGVGGASGAGGTGTAGGAGRLGGGGLLGSTGGAAGGAGGNTTTVTSSPAAGAGGRGAGGMMGGGGGGSEDRERRGGLGGMMAPKLDDESDAAPRSAGASAGGRDQQPTD